MLASFLTTLFFSLSVIFAARSARVLGPGAANLARLLLATFLLAAWAHLFGSGLQGPSLPWFFLSGVIGFGLGDLALFAALPRIGPRLAILLTQCLAAPIATFTEWSWLDTRLRSAELICAATILTGVALALAPDRSLRVRRSVFWVGIVFGVCSALGQALGAVISRKANTVAMIAGVEIDGGTAAYQRILGGALIAAIAIVFFPSGERVEKEERKKRWRHAWPLVAANALAGPAIGVGCYQWALKTTPSGIVLPIVATSPLVTMLLAWVIDREHPTVRGVAGGVIAVAGAATLATIQ